MAPMNKPAKAFPAKFPGKCERCLGRITKNRPIMRCPGVHNAYQHATAADCREAFRADQSARMADALHQGLITAEQAASVIARDDAASKYPDELAA